MYTFTTSLDLDDSKMHIQSYMQKRTKSQWVLSHKDEQSLTFQRTQKPSILTFFVLLFFFVLPAILYLIFSWKKQSCSFFLKKAGKGTQITVEAGIQSKGRGKALLRHFAQYDESLALLPDAKLSFFDSNTPLYIFFGVLGVVLILIAILAALPR